MSSQYWIRRVKEMNQKAVQLNTEQAQKELLKLYQNQSNELYYRIMHVFAKIDNDKLENGKIYYFAVAAWSAYDMRVVGNLSKEVFARPLARLK